jgi:aminomethyltransferase
MRTPLYEVHARLGARFVPFAGWDMPVQYTGILEEHRAVRERAGLFDVSHMGEVEVRGPRALEAAQRLTVNDVARLRDGQVQYSMLCLPTGGVVDDITVQRLSGESFLFCVNASNAEKDFEWMRANAGGAEVIDRSSEFALLALQGPRAAAILGRCTRLDLAALRSFWFARGEVAGIGEVLVARTGYTGEDGFELYCPSAGAVGLWNALMSEGESDGLQAAGLGARDTLRLERALPLYGHELDEATTPLEAGLAWVVKLDTDFIGRDALARQKAEGVTRKLVGLRMLEAGIPRQGYALRVGAEVVGAVTSGTQSPTLGKPIALGYVGVAHAAVGTRIEVEIRKRGVAAEVVALPFYKRR